MKDKLTPKTITFGFIVCFLPLLMYGVDDIVDFLSRYDIYLGWPGGEYMLRINRSCMCLHAPRGRPEHCVRIYWIARSGLCLFLPHRGLHCWNIDGKAWG